MSTIYSNVSVVPILGCLWWLLLLLFIKLDHASKYGIACFIMKEFNKSFNFLNYFKNYPLINCVHPANNYQKAF
jgi:hypothetical protein